MWRSFLTASLGLGAVWIGLINLADAAAVPISRRVKQDAVQRLVSGLALSGSNAQEAVQALNAHPDLLCDGNDNNTCTASTPSPNSNSYIAAEKAKSRAALACHIARLVFDGNVNTLTHHLIGLTSTRRRSIGTRDLSSQYIFCSLVSLCFQHG